MRWYQAAFLILLTSVLGSCGSILGTDCTEVGCTSGVEIILEQPPAGPYRVEVVSGPGDARYVYECSEARCPDRVFFPDFTPHRVFVRVITEEGTQQYEVIPQYVESRPNGRRCPPLCRRAQVRLPSDRLGG